MHRFDSCKPRSNHVVRVFVAMCILVLAGGPGAAAAQDKEPSDPASGDIATESRQVGGGLVASGRFVQLEGRYRLLAPGLHAGELFAATGDSLDLGSLRGKHVLLDFWASWCRPCIEEIPELNALAEEFRDNEDVVFISVNQDALTSGGDLEYVRRLIDEGLIEYPVLIDDAEPSLKRMFKIRAWPTRLLISPDGEILLSPAGRLALEDAAEYLRHR